MVEAKARLNENGRVVIPAAFRKALGLRPGDQVILRLEADEVRMFSRRLALERARRLVRKYVPDDVDLAAELIADRRREAARE